MIQRPPLSVFFMAELDLKDKVINQKQENIEVLKKDLIEKEKKISNLEKMIKEKDVKKKRSSSVFFQT